MGNKFHVDVVINNCASWAFPVLFVEKSWSSFTRVRGREDRQGREERCVLLVLYDQKDRSVTRSKVVRVCPYMAGSSQEHPSLSRRTLRCRLQDSKFVWDKQNKQSERASPFRLPFSLFVSLILWRIPLSRTTPPEGFNWWHVWSEDFAFDEFIFDASGFISFASVFGWLFTEHSSARKRNRSAVNNF